MNFGLRQSWAGPQFVPLCAFPQLAQRGFLLRMCALIRRQLTAELRLRTKKYSCGPYFHYAQYRIYRERERISCLFLCVSGLSHTISSPPPPPMLFASLLCWTKKTYVPFLTTSGSVRVQYSICRVGGVGNIKRPRGSQES